MKRFRYAFLLSLCVLYGVPVVLGQPFIEVSSALPEGTIASAVPGDYDGDGDLDILIRLGLSVEGTLYDHVSILRNDVTEPNGTWTFEDIELFTTEGISMYDFLRGDEVSWADYDNDGDLDIFAGRATAPSMLLRNDDGTFAVEHELPSHSESLSIVSYDFSTVSWADYDNDGDLDLLVPYVDDGEEGRAVLFENTDNGFVDSGIPLPGILEGQTQWADYDNDGDLDLLMITPFSVDHPDQQGFTRIYRNEAGTLTETSDDFVTFFNSGTASWVDYDNDGDLDVVAVGDTVDTALEFDECALTEDNGSCGVFATVYRNDGGAFARVVPFLSEDIEPFQSFFGATAADYDGDGDVDLLISGVLNGEEGDGVSRVFRNDGNAFVASGDEIVAPWLPYDGTVLWADFDGDGDLDYGVGGSFSTGPGQGATDFKLFRNDAPGQNAAPLAPTALDATVEEDEVTFSWGEASDDHTPSAALTYNLWVRERMGSDIVSPMSRQSGQRLLPAPGNVSHNMSWTYDLPPGEYEWRVQAIDNAFNGGAFAEGGTFVVGATDTEDAVVPNAFAVGAAFPNPLRNEGALRLDLPDAAEVTVTLYDVLGREVLAVPPQQLAAGADREVAFDTGALPSGVYLFRVEAALPERVERASGRLTVLR